MRKMGSRRWAHVSPFSGGLGVSPSFKAEHQLNVELYQP